MSQFQIQRAPVLQIDLNQATYQAFLNCINSFQGLETTSAMESGVSMMESKVSLERFIDNLGVLAGLIEEPHYESGMKKPEAFKYWASLVKKLKDDHFFKSARRLAHL